MEKRKFKMLIWEPITEMIASEITERLVVHGGWLVCRSDAAKKPATLAMCFVDDPNHAWNIEPVPVTTG